MAYDAVIVQFGPIAEAAVPVMHNAFRLVRPIGQNSGAEKACRGRMQLRGEDAELPIISRINRQELAEFGAPTFSAGQPLYGFRSSGKFERGAMLQEHRHCTIENLDG